MFQFVRGLLFRLLARRLKGHVTVDLRGGPRGPGGAGGIVIEGEFEEVAPEDRRSAGTQPRLPPEGGPGRTTEADP